ncbi:uncharacterized protein LOC115735685 isoform X2 [Rhodamnia argentea]|uniref:Uncharacterized protein LOC115735685 isoform X2 n=1 Tax=Rhodamnia argentea TaxID=178133 RepID=A0ABM3GX26_9MYRT|nr:uncharacterized protein LOC115735685 isoform X2 [Rhodamnia argentea]
MASVFPSSPSLDSLFKSYRGNRSPPNPPGQFRLGCPRYSKGYKNFRIEQMSVVHNGRHPLLCAMGMAARHSGDPERVSFHHLLDKGKKLWDNSPEPVKRFPWIRALENFIQLILDVVLAVCKFLCVPLLAVSSLSEMSYCAHEKKLRLVPLPILFGIAFAGVLNGTALELSPLLKDAEVPWHLIAIAVFFTMLKLPGPYYPYWGRILIPHFANGGLLRILWYAFLWNRRPQKGLV